MSGWGGITPILTFPHRGGRDPRPGPAGSCLRRNDEWECAGGRSPILTFPPRGKGYPAALPLWIPAFAGMTSGGGGGTLPHPNLPPEGEGIPRDPAPLDSCLRRNDEWGCAGGRSPILTFPPRGKGYPAAPPLWIPAFAGMTSGGGGGTLPHPNLPPEGEGISRDPAPLDSCLRRNDEWGWAGTTVGVEGGRSPILTFPPRGKGYPATLPLWIPAFAGMTSGGVRERRWGCAGRAGVPAGGLSQAGHVGSGVGVAACQMDNPAMTFYSSGIA